MVVFLDVQGIQKQLSILLDLAGANPIGIICEIMNDDGTMARVDSLEKVAKI